MAKIIHLIHGEREAELSLFARRHDFEFFNIYLEAKFRQENIKTGPAYAANLPTCTYTRTWHKDIPPLHLRGYYPAQNKIVRRQCNLNENRKPAS